MTNTLLDFFYERDNIIKFSKGFSQIGNLKIVTRFRFITSNYKTDEENTIELHSLSDLKLAAKSYYEDTEINFEDFILIPELLNKDKPMFVHLQVYLNN